MLGLILLVCLAPVLQARVIYVQAGSGKGNGLSWEKAYDDLQEAI